MERPPIFRFWDDNHESEVHILTAENTPQAGVKSYATIGLSDHVLMHDGKPFDTRVELVGACGSVFKDFDNVLATLAFNVINSKMFCAPGVIFPGVMDMYDLSDSMSDIYFTYPFLWEETLSSAKVAGRDIAWLLAMPISRKETEFAQEFGPDALEKKFSTHDIDIYNLNRPSVV